MIECFEILEEEKTIDTLCRFLKFINKDDESGCWNWVGYKNKDLYGKKRHNGKKVFSHRFSYAFFIGKIPYNIMVCHKCDNPSCCNPEHLF